MHIHEAYHHIMIKGTHNLIRSFYLCLLGCLGQYLLDAAKAVPEHAAVRAVVRHCDMSAFELTCLEPVSLCLPCTRLARMQFPSCEACSTSARGSGLHVTGYPLDRVM